MNAQPALPPAVGRVLIAATRALILAGAEPGAFPDPDRNGTARRLAALFAALPSDRRRLLTAGTRVIDLLSRCTRGRAFHRLTPEGAARVLDRCGRSRLAPLRRLASVVAAMTRYAYFSGEESWPVIGYDGPWLGRIPVDTHPAPRIEVEGS